MLPNSIKCKIHIECSQRRENLLNINYSLFHQEISSNFLTMNKMTRTTRANDLITEVIYMPCYCLHALNFFTSFSYQMKYFLQFIQEDFLKQHFEEADFSQRVAASTLYSFYSEQWKEMKRKPESTKFLGKVMTSAFPKMKRMKHLPGFFFK